MTTKLILHIPHSSFFIPQKYKKLFLVTEEELHQELLKMTDSYTDELFYVSNAKRIIFNINRLICDVERFRDEAIEEMTKQGMWVCYTMTSNQTPLKIVSEKHKQEILEKFYDKHHYYFTQVVSNILAKNNKCIIIDCHSFSSKVLLYELHSVGKRPDICIGTDEFHTPKSLAEQVYNEFIKLGYTVHINNPFQGTIIPLDYYRKNKQVMSLMIEINRGIYMNEVSGIKLPVFEKLKNDINYVLKQLLL